MTRSQIIKRLRVIQKQIQQKEFRLNKRDLKEDEDGSWFGERDEYSHREECNICMMSNLITDQHHIVEVAEIADFIVTQSAFKVLENVPFFHTSSPTVWLCPNHHTLVHKLESFDRFLVEDLFEKWDGKSDPVHCFGAVPQVIAISQLITDEYEWQRFKELMARREQERKKLFKGILEYCATTEQSSQTTTPSRNDTNNNTSR